ncbi:diguanylate cyclase [Catenovulum sediminis]|uniref:diguanylate cyclase n=1 Tax=Catenovulum sediminis TaxID=1740262 RepID=A0ABV1RJT0_9ALTE|nr:diguanylate cyclase [Catenovulum sediminis]
MTNAIDNQQSVLIVDDQNINTLVLENALSPLYTVYTANGGQAALNILHSQTSIDLVLLDIQMPDLDGYQVLLDIRQNDATKNIPVIFISAKDAAEDEAKGLEFGAMDYITKPFNITVVKARVRNQLSLKKKSDLLEKLANIDGLTEVPNRRRYDEKLDLEWRRCARSSSPLSMIMLDIDAFKPFNDNYGHSAGDEILKQVASTLSKKIRRSGDEAFRYGGEEFVILLPETSFESSIRVAEMMREAIEALDIPHEYSPVEKHITVSLGVSSIVPVATMSAKTLQEFTDLQLYKAKNAGRNQVQGELLQV